MHRLNSPKLAGLVLTLSLAAATASAQITGVPNFQKVDEHVYRGGQPSSEGFRNLSSLGVRTVIDLREIGEHSQAEESSWVQSSGMRYVSIPLKGMSAPSEENVKKVLAILNDSSAGPVFVHCRRGADRTGTMIACYRISHDGWQSRKALHEAKSYGMSMWERAMQSYVSHYAAPAAAPAEAVAATAAVQP